jgi:uncharacterized membrane protein
MGLNFMQEVFTIFYAIAWGTVSNVQPRWGAFEYAAVRGPKGFNALLRIVLSWILLNFAAVFFFVWVLYLLNGAPWQIELAPLSTSKFWLTIAAIAPALAPFGLYKFWMGLVQAGNKFFFTDREVKDLQESHKNRAFEGAIVNIIAGLALIILAGAVPKLFS